MLQLSYLNLYQNIWWVLEIPNYKPLPRPGVIQIWIQFLKYWYLAKYPVLPSRFPPVPRQQFWPRSLRHAKVVNINISSPPAASRRQFLFCWKRQQIWKGEISHTYTCKSRGVYLEPAICNKTDRTHAPWTCYNIGGISVFREHLLIGVFLFTFVKCLLRRWTSPNLGVLNIR